jgi:hypothetical protein
MAQWVFRTLGAVKAWTLPREPAGPASNKVGAQPAESDTGFLSLPGELRNQIYELLLLREHPIDFVRCDSLRVSNPPPGAPVVALLRVNKAIHREAASLLYGANCFDFVGHSISPIPFSRQVGATNMAHLGHLRVYLFIDSTNLACIRDSCTGLRRVTAFVPFVHEIAEPENEESRRGLVRALSARDAGFRSVASLREFFLESKNPGGEEESRTFIEREMVRLGWKLRPIAGLRRENVAE